MIRRLLVTFVAIVMAMAAGIALGGGPLSDIGRTPSQAAAPPAPPAADPQDETRAAYADAFAEGVAPGLYADRLHGHPVTIVTLPGADAEDVEALTAQVQAAGTQVIAAYALRRGLVDTREKTLVDTLGLQLVEQLGADVVSADATTYDRIGQLIGRAVSAPKRSEALDPARVASLRASLQGAGLVAVPDGEPNLAPLVLVVTGREVEQPVLAGLVDGLAAIARGVVVAGPTGDASVTGLRAAPPVRPVATVDGTETAAGRVASILALVHVLTTPGGSFGASGADSPVPLG
ncbi:MAG TPA: copper transporter [Nocardioides sp.]|nr:copper transporter [Nocardioides sp.]